MYAVAAVLLQKYPILQIFSAIFASGAMLMLLLKLKPFDYIHNLRL